MSIVVNGSFLKHNRAGYQALEHSIIGKKKMHIYMSLFKSDHRQDINLWSICGNQLATIILTVWLTGWPVDILQVLPLKLQLMIAGPQTTQWWEIYVW